MKFTDGELTDKECKFCEGVFLKMETSFRDAYDYNSGHYTVDCPILVCPKCDYSEDYEHGEE